MAQGTIGLRLDKETQARLRVLGEARDRSPHYLMKAAIAEFLAREEAVEAEKALLTERWARFELTGETVSQDAMKAWAADLPDKTQT